MSIVHDTCQPRTAIHEMWASVAGAWERHADELERRSGGITEAILDRAAVGNGDRVLELASGPGGAGLAAAERVGAAGEVVVSDVVPAMVDAARRRAAARGLSNVRAKVLDLEAIEEADGSFDVVICREGLMFAVSPAKAVREIRRVLRVRGRLGVAVWASRNDNPWLGILLDAIATVTGAILPPPGRPGPFALADGDALVALFRDAGFEDVKRETLAAPLRSPSFDAWWRRSETLAGPVVAFLSKLDDTTRARVRDAAADAARVYATDDGLVLPASAHVVTGRRS